LELRWQVCLLYQHRTLLLQQQKPQQQPALARACQMAALSLPWAYLVVVLLRHYSVRQQEQHQGQMLPLQLLVVMPGVCWFLAHMGHQQQQQHQHQQLRCHRWAAALQSEQLLSLLLSGPPVLLSCWWKVAAGGGCTPQHDAEPLPVPAAVAAAAGAGRHRSSAQASQKQQQVQPGLLQEYLCGSKEGG
jgi:hypothetical protein